LNPDGLEQGTHRKFRLNLKMNLKPGRRQVTGLLIERFASECKQGD
jgi:hypothetical protein